MVAPVHLHAGQGAVLAELPGAEAPPRGKVPVQVHAQAVLGARVAPGG